MHNDNLTEYNQVRQAVLDSRFANWCKAFDGVEAPSTSGTKVGFPNSSAYLFNTNGFLWAVDPVYNPHDEPDEEELAVMRRLLKYELLIITHTHGDHAKAATLKYLHANSQCHFIISTQIAERFDNMLQVSPERLTVLNIGQTIEIRGIEITCWQGFHDNLPPAGPFPSSSYHLRMPDGKRIFMPVDVRDYSKPIPAQVAPVDYLFSHIWLGRGICLEDDFPMLGEFCEFMLQSNPRTIFLGHINEVSRVADSMWLPRHAALVIDHLSRLAPSVDVKMPRHGEVLRL
jgi:hypothetical protein